MNFYSDETYGERVAGVYDDWYGDLDRTRSIFSQNCGSGRLWNSARHWTPQIPLAWAKRWDSIDVAQAMIDQLVKTRLQD